MNIADTVKNEKLLNIMGIFDFFTKKKATSNSDDWLNLYIKLSGLLYCVIQDAPTMAVDGYARIVLKNDWTVSVQAHKCPPENILNESDVAFVFFQENEAEYAKWIEGLQNEMPIYQQHATQEFAKFIINEFKKQVVVN